MKRKYIDEKDEKSNKLLKIGLDNDKIYIIHGIFSTYSDDIFTKSIVHILNNIHISEMLLNFINLDKNFYIYNVNNTPFYEYPINIKDLIILQYNKILKQFINTTSPNYLKLFLKIKDNNLYKYLDMEKNSRFPNECNENLYFLNNKV